MHGKTEFQHVFYLILFFNRNVFCLPFCNDIASNTVATLCAKYANYSSVHYAEPFPIPINTTLIMNEILSVDEDLQVVNILLTLNANWVDTRVQLHYNKNDQPRNYPWHKTTVYEFDAIWKPQLYFSNSIFTKLAEDVPTELWFVHNSGPFTFWWTRTFTVSISCQMEFQGFPFDSHECKLKLVDFNNARFSHLVKPRVYFQSNTERLAFEMEVKSNVPTEVTLKPEFTVLYSEASIDIKLERKVREFWKLISEFYLPTFIFSKLALISYSIPVDSVPGRMGLLITLYFITTNIYVNTIAPSTRGISHMDIWIIGAKIPIQIGIFQYGIILSISRFGNGYIFGHKFNFKRVDFTTLILTFVVSAIFDVSYFMIFCA